MLSEKPGLIELLDRDLIAFLTAVNPSGQPQTSPVWFLRVDEDLVVYNRPRTPRLAAIAVNPKVALNLRGDLRAKGAVTMEGVATRDEGLPKAMDLPGYVAKYGLEIESLGWTPESFSDDYTVPIRVAVARVRAWGLKELSA